MKNGGVDTVQTTQGTDAAWLGYHFMMLSNNGCFIILEPDEGIHTSEQVVIDYLRFRLVMPPRPQCKRKYHLRQRGKKATRQKE